MTKAEMYDIVAKNYIDKYDVIAMKGNTKRIYHYNADIGIWVNDGDETIARFVVNELPSMNKKDGKEIIHKIAKLAAIDNNIFSSSTKHIAVKNGVYNMVTGLLENFSKDHYLTRRLNVTYNPTISCPFFMTRLYEILDDRSIELLFELIGYILYPSYHIPMIMFFVGDGGNGKSVIFEIIQNLVGMENVSGLSLEMLANKDKYKFSMYKLEHKMVNIGGDIEKTPLYKSAFLKSISGGDYVTVEKKGGEPYDIKNLAKLVFAANEVPYISDDTPAMKERIHILKFRNKVRGTGNMTKDDVLNGCTTDTEMSGIFNNAMKGLQKLLKRNGFYTKEELTEQRRVVETTVNPLGLFIKERCEFNDTFEIKKSALLLAYNQWAVSNDVKKISSARKLKKTLEYHDTVEEIKTENSAKIPYLCGVRLKIVNTPIRRSKLI